MNNNINHITKGVVEVCKECITVAYNIKVQKKEMLRAWGSNGNTMIHPIQKIRISQDTFNFCIKNKVLLYDYFILMRSQLTKKIEHCHKIGH